MYVCITNYFIMNLSTKNFSIYIAIAITALFFSGCASLTGFQDGRAVGEGNGEISASLSLSQSPDFKIDDFDSDSSDNSFPNLYFPNLEAGGKYGITNKLDFIFKVNSTFNLNAGVKYQLIGDQESLFAFGVGAEAGTFAIISQLWNIQIPLYASLHPTEKFGVYFSPRYIYQFNAFAGIKGWNYLGGNFGILFGNKHKFGLDISYYKVNTSGLVSSNLLSFGFGGRFSL